MPNPSPARRRTRLSWCLRATGVLCASLIVSACAGRGAVLPGEAVTLEVGRTAVFRDGVSLQYVGIENDSRCPVGVQCIRAGDAEVLFDLVRSGRPATRVVLNSAQRLSATTEAGTLQLVELGAGPAPRATVRLDPGTDEASPP